MRRIELWVIGFLLFSFLLAPAHADKSTPRSRGKLLLFPQNSHESTIRKNMVKFSYKLDNGRVVPFCSGVISGPNEVLSASHCFESAHIKNYLSGGEKIIVSTGNKVVTATKIQFQGDPDIARVTLDAEADVNSSVPITDQCDPQSDYFVGGFGVGPQPLGNKGLPNLATYTKPERQIVIGDKRPFVLKKKDGAACGGDSGGGTFCFANGRLSLFGVFIQYSAPAL